MNKFAPFMAITLAVGAAVGWFAPGSDGPASPTASDADEAAQLEVLRQEQWLAGEVVLERESDGHFYADVEADGVTAHMLVDTGASVVALTGEDAEAMGITWDSDAVQPVASGASGEVLGLRVTIDRLQLGQIEVENVEAIVVPEGLAISLLGQSFLSKVGRVEMNEGRMVLGG